MNKKIIFSKYIFMENVQNYKRCSQSCDLIIRNLLSKITQLILVVYIAFIKQSDQVQKVNAKPARFFQR